MIKVQVIKCDGYFKISVLGHADYAEKGKDIVCAAVSAIIQTAAAGLQMIANQYPDHVKVEVTTDGDADEGKP